MGIERRHIKIGDEQVPVSEEIYLEYMRPLWAEQKRKDRRSRCRDGRGRRCMKDCGLCAERREAKQAGMRTGRDLSLDKFMEDGFDIADTKDLSELVAEKMMKESLHEAISALPKEERIIIDAISEAMSERNTAAAVGLTRSKFTNRRDKIIKRLRNILTKK